MGFDATELAKMLLERPDATAAPEHEKRHESQQAEEATADWHRLHGVLTTAQGRKVEARWSRSVAYDGLAGMMIKAVCYGIPDFRRAR